MKYYYRLLPPRTEPEQLNYLILVFAILFALLVIAPAFLNGNFVFYPLMKNGDVLDLFTPFILIPLYWKLFKVSPKNKPNQQETLIFMLLAVFWIQGQGMHLAANSIGHLTKELTDTNNIKVLTYFYDETLSHYWWDCGAIGLSALLIYRHGKYLKRDRTLKFILPVIAGIIHGFTYFVGIVESGTASIGVPFAVIVVCVLFWKRRNTKQQPMLAFYFVTYLVACLFFLEWGIYHGGLPEFSEIGII